MKVLEQLHELFKAHDFIRRVWVEQKNLETKKILWDLDEKMTETINALAKTFPKLGE